VPARRIAQASDEQVYGVAVAPLDQSRATAGRSPRSAPATTSGTALEHMRRGLHCLIVSGGYGALRPEELIQPYEAQLQHTRSVSIYLLSSDSTTVQPTHGLSTAVQRQPRALSTTRPEAIQATPDGVRDLLMTTILDPARTEGRTTVAPLRAGEVHQAMQLSNRLPLVCSVMDGRKFRGQAQLKLVSRTGPRQGASATYVYRVL
jgi:hypothetical protein